MREGQFRNASGCAIACIFHRDKQKENGVRIKEAMRLMHDRSNGLGAGFAAYGIYPQYENAYALHVFYDTRAAKQACENKIRESFHIEQAEEIPTKPHPNIKDAPYIWRYFVYPHNCENEEQKLVDFVFEIQKEIIGAYLFSCGKNMGVFKGVGYPEDIADFFQLENYDAYTWIAHGRYPTNTPGWWAGAHPFALLDKALVHNGEISSYDANRRYIEMFHYPCNLLTDTEVISYMFDYLQRVKKMTLNECAQIMAAPFWSEIDAMPQEEKRYYTMLRRNFSSLLISGPFSIILGHKDGIFALNDRFKLRALMIAQKENTYYLASEESAIRAIQMDVDSIDSLAGGVGFSAHFKEDTK